MIRLTPSACSRVPLAISFAAREERMIASESRRIAAPAWPATARPASARRRPSSTTAVACSMARRISARISCTWAVECWDRSASARTSCAMTANPVPAVPDLLDTIAALRASIFDSADRSRTASMIRPTWRVRSTRSCSIRVFASICSPSSLTARTACSIDSSPSRELSVLDAARSSTACALLCALTKRSRRSSIVRSVSAALAAWARECSSWRVAPSNTSSEVDSMATAASRISATTARVLLRSSSRAEARRPTSSSAGSVR